MNQTKNKRRAAKPTKGQPSRDRKPARSRQMVIGLSVVLLSIVLAAGFLLWRHRNPVSSSSEGHQNSTAAKMSGEALAQIHCAMCHLYPEPALLDRKTWKERALPEMKVRVGLNPEELNLNREAKYLKASGIFPERPLFSMEEWNLIEAFYLANAPVEIQSTIDVDKIEIELPGFDVEFPDVRQACPATTLTFIDKERGQIFVGDMKRKTLGLFDSAIKLQQAISLDNVPVAVLPVESGIYLTSIGSFMPSDIPKGSLSFLPRIENKYGPPQVLFSELPRPVHAASGDLNGDGLMDLVVSMFGHNVGRLSWFENRGEENFVEHVLLHRPGTIHTVLKDMNGDGFLDILALVTQELESLEIFYNNGRGEFTSERVFQKHPLFGHTYFELADFNGDGKPDLLVANGDNGEYESPLKSYHGLRIYMNRGNGKFEEEFFFPMNGAYRTVTADFDQDGDLDIAAISYFPDYRQFPREGFVYLQNQGNFSFRPFTFPDVGEGRWLTLHAGDLDGDGDLDLVLGSNSHAPTRVPQSLFDKWENTGPSFVILRNQLRSSEAQTPYLPVKQ